MPKIKSSPRNVQRRTSPYCEVMAQPFKMIPVCDVEDGTPRITYKQAPEIKKNQKQPCDGLLMPEPEFSETEIVDDIVRRINDVDGIYEYAAYFNYYDEMKNWKDTDVFDDIDDFSVRPRAPISRPPGVVPPVIDSTDEPDQDKDFKFINMCAYENSVTCTRLKREIRATQKRSEKLHQDQTCERAARGLDLDEEYNDSSDDSTECSLSDSDHENEDIEMDEAPPFDWNNPTNSWDAARRDEQASKWGYGNFGRRDSHQQGEE